MSWYTGKEVSSFCDTCAGYVPDSGRANLTNFLTCSHIFYLNTQVIASALTVFEDQFFGVPGLTGAYFVQGADPVGLNIGIQRGRVDGSGFIEDGDMNLVNGTWLTSSVGAPAASHLWLNLNQSLATAQCMSNQSLPGMHKNCGLSRPLFLLPGAFARAINCSEGVFADQRNVWTQYLAAHRESYTSKFAGFGVKYDDANNIYTGAVGAFLGALAIGAASLLYYLFAGGLHCMLHACWPQP